MLLPLQGAFSPDINPGRFPGLGASGLSARVNHTGRNHFSPFQPYSLKIISARVNRTAWKSFQPVSTIQLENHFSPCQPYSLKIISARVNHTGRNYFSPCQPYRSKSFQPVSTVQLENYFSPFQPYRWKHFAKLLLFFEYREHSFIKNV